MVFFLPCGADVPPPPASPELSLLFPFVEMDISEKFPETLEFSVDVEPSPASWTNPVTAFRAALYFCGGKRRQNKFQEMRGNSRRALVMTCFPPNIERMQAVNVYFPVGGRVNVSRLFTIDGVYAAM